MCLAIVDVVVPICMDIDKSGTIELVESDKEGEKEETEKSKKKTHLNTFLNERSYQGTGQLKDKGLSNILSYQKEPFLEYQDPPPE